MINPTTWVKQASFHMEDCFYNFELCMNIADWWDLTIKGFI